MENELANKVFLILIGLPEGINWTVSSFSVVQWVIPASFTSDFIFFLILTFCRCFIICSLRLCFGFLSFIHLLWSSPCTPWVHDVAEQRAASLQLLQKERWPWHWHSPCRCQGGCGRFLGLSQFLAQHCTDPCRGALWNSTYLFSEAFWMRFRFAFVCYLWFVWYWLWIQELSLTTIKHFCVRLKQRIVSNLIPFMP